MTAPTAPETEAPPRRRRRRLARVLVDQATAQMGAALRDVTAARTELDIAVAELHTVIDAQEGP